MEDPKETPILAPVEGGEILSKEGAPERAPKAPPKPPQSAAWKEFFEKFEKESGAEQKVLLVLAFMREALGEKGSARFRDFWEARRVGLPLFKEGLPPAFRTTSWDEFTELSKQARQLKEMLDEQSSFAAEQIELAISAIETDMADFNRLLLEIPDAILPEFPRAIEKKKGDYSKWQRELHLLGAFANRIQSLRKEIIATDVRMRQKNKLLERLSLLADRVFPRRKELVKEISEAFSQDIDLFHQKFFGEKADKKKPPLFALREEIKALQAAAKKFTLSTPCFTETRKKLSAAWDQVRGEEKEKRQVFEEKKEIFQKNFALVQEKIAEVATLCAAAEIERDPVEKVTREVRDMLDKLELMREGKKELEILLKSARAPLDEKLAAGRAAKEKRRERERRGEKAGNRPVLPPNRCSFPKPRENRSKGTRRVFPSAPQSKASPQSGREEKLASLEESFSGKLLEREFALASTEDELVAVYEKLQEKEGALREELQAIRRTLGGSNLDITVSFNLRRQSEEKKAGLEKIQRLLKKIEAKIE